LAASLIGASLGYSFAVRADPEPPVFLELEGCSELDESEVRRIMSAELRARPVDAKGPDVTEVSISCSANGAAVKVRDPISRKTVRRSFDLGTAEPKARGRLVAIGATELVLASWAELFTNPNPKVEPEGPRPSPPMASAARSVASGAKPPSTAPTTAHPAPRPPPSPPASEPARYEPRPRPWYVLDSPADRQFRVVGVASARGFFKSDGILWGGGLRFGEERFRFVSWSADVLVETGSLATSGNQYGVTTTTAGGALMLYYKNRHFTARLGAGLRAGFAGATHGGSAAASLAPWGWPLGTTSVTLRISRSVVIDLAAEAGYMVLPVPGTGEKSIEGAWFSGQFGIGFIPDAIVAGGG
jgi:hypothetical protein